MPDKSGKRVIVIDVGHGAVPLGSLEDKRYGAVNGFDTGYKTKYKNHEVTEFQVSLKNAELLRDFLEEKGFEVHLTTDKGERGKKISNAKNFASRFDIAKKYDADLYISIHANAQQSFEHTTKGNLSGPLIFTDFKINKSTDFLRYDKVAYLDSDGKIDFIEPEKAKKTLSRIEPANQDSYNLVQKLQSKMKENGYSKRGLTNFLDESNNGVLQNLDTSIPRILIEAGYMTNSGDLKDLVEGSDKIKSMFKDIAETIKIHFDEKNKPKKVEIKREDFFKILKDGAKEKIFTEDFTKSIMNPFENSNDINYIYNAPINKFTKNIQK